MSRESPARCIHVVGATGAVGREAISILHALGVEAPRVRALASSRSAGQHVRFGESSLVVEGIPPESRSLEVAPGDLLLLCADAETSRRLGPPAVAAGATVIDNSSAFRLDPGVPLVVPEINPGDLPPTGGRLIASPNCSTVILLTAIEPLRRAFGLRAIDVATYQAVSGAGSAGIDELLTQTGDHLAGRPVTPRVFSEPCAFNLFSHDSAVDPRDGVNGEERKVIDEARRILGDPALRVTPTCVRVPVLRAHTQAITVTLDRPATERLVRHALSLHAADCGLVVLDDRHAGRFPTPRLASNADAVLVGRIRPDPGEPSGAGGTHRRWCLLASGDQLRKGAALNVVQIAQRMGLLPRDAKGRPGRAAAAEIASTSTEPAGSV